MEEKEPDRENPANEPHTRHEEPDAATAERQARRLLIRLALATVRVRQNGRQT